MRACEGENRNVKINHEQGVFWFSGRQIYRCAPEACGFESTLKQIPNGHDSTATFV